MRAEVKVQRADEALGRPVAGEVEMGDLTECVDPGVGPAGGNDRHGLAGAGQDGGLDGGLDGGGVALALPALERPAVIFEQQAVARIGSAEPGAQGEREAALQLVGRHGLATGAVGPG